MRKISEIIIHCSATKHSSNIGVNEIRKWHMARGWSDIGYHYVIRRDGVVEDGRPNQKVGAHAKGRNKYSIGVCLVGGLNADGKPSTDFSPEQMEALKALLHFLQTTYSIPTQNVRGHRDLPNVRKDCPCFDVSSWLGSRVLVRPRKMA